MNLKNLIFRLGKGLYYDQKSNWDRLALKYMKNCDNILDAGCGKGRFIKNSPKIIIGVDHNKESLKLCKNKGFNVVYSKVTKLRFKNNYFEGIHSSHVIEHLFPLDAYKFLKEMDRVLKIGGIFCLRTPLLYDGFYNDFTHIKPYNPDAILHYLTDANEDSRTLDGIPGRYKVIKLKYRRNQLFPNLSRTTFWFLAPFFNLLYRFKISSFRKTGYILILKKIR